MVEDPKEILKRVSRQIGNFADNHRRFPADDKDRRFNGIFDGFLKNIKADIDKANDLINLTPLAESTANTQKPTNNNE